MISNEAKTLIKKMLDTNPSTRLSAVQAYNDPWVQQNSPQPTIQKNLLELVSANIKTFHETTKLQRAVIRFIASQLLTSVEKNELTAIFLSLDSGATGKISEKDLTIF